MIIALLLAAADESGGWQYTKWGMTEAEEKASATSGTVPFSHADADREGSQSKLLTIHSAGKIKFNVVFRFSASDRLNGVLLLPKDYSDCRAILEEMRAAYGAPEEEARPAYSMLVRWRVPATGSTVRFFTMETTERVWDKSKPPRCDVEYTPMSNPKAIGF